jgi:FkbM family methyltransferase
MIKKLKIIIVNLLTCQIIGRLIAKFYNNLIPYYGVTINTSKISNYKTKALIFWKLYEKAEIHFVKKYITEKYDVIEFGSSIGVVSSILGKIINEKKLICVEANPNIIPILENNLKINHIKNFKIYNCALGNPSEKTSNFEFGSSNTTGKISSALDNNALVENITLQKIIKQNKIGKYNIVCDIEGAEYFLIKYNFKELEKCNILIIEVHDFKHESINVTSDDIITMICWKTNMTLIDKKGNVLVFKNNI